ncbi:hypothetical protein CesoFtcFv8_026300 [Champsocephalus esox]|uniref:Calponin-homology (CH) domain-containing protein n=1 Tax=Champsocephalus esox TaxID=159716 RepID=A0AAN8GD28_9TELE|nr:hypothetical protein CesoFtcFv8_026300 [Champsocephalus esox]
MLMFVDMDSVKVQQLFKAVNRCGQSDDYHPALSSTERLSGCSEIYTDWANHYLAKSGCQRLIKDLSQDVTDGVLLAQIIQIIANEKVQDINGSPRSQSQMIENVDACLNFLDAKGVNVTGLSAEEIRNGNLKSILGLFFILSRYKQQQQQQQQYFQSLVELSQQSSSSSASSSRTADMQSRLPGPSRVPAAGSGASRSSGSSNLNRRSQSFNSIDKSKPLQYASGNDREALRGIPLPGGMNGSCSGGGSVPSSLSGQQLVSSSIPSPTKSWRSKSMNLKHSATSSMLSSPALSPSEAPDALHDGSKAGGGGGGHHQRSMLEKFRLINPRSASRASPSVAEMSLEEEDDLSEYGEDGFTNLACSSGSSSTANQISTKTPSPSITAPSRTSPSSSSSSSKANRTGASSKDREDKSSSRSGQKSSKDSSSPKEESSPADGNKKNSKIASLIPKGGKPSKKDGGNSSSGIPKSGLKAPSSSSSSSSSTSTTAKPQSQSPALNSSGNLRGGEADRGKMTKGGQGGSFYIQRSSGGSETKRTSLTSSTSTSALSGSTGMLGGGGGGVGGGGALGGNGVVQLPQQQQHNHPNTATVAPFMYRTFSENDCTMMAPAEPCLSPTKGELVYSKTAKQCLEEISALLSLLQRAVFSVEE